MSKLFIQVVPDIVPDIIVYSISSYPILYPIKVPDIVPDIEESYSISNKKPSISKVVIRYRRKNLRYRARYSKFACLCHLISDAISKVFLRYRRNDLRYRRFYPSLPPDIEGLYSISVAISNISRSISSIYRCRVPISNCFYSISNVSSINLFHISISCTICDTDIGYDVVLTC